MISDFDRNNIDTVFQLLNGRLEINHALPVRLVVCGGAGLIATGLLARTTSDVDLVALVNEANELTAPVPLPVSLTKAAYEVAMTLSLPVDWLNNAPSRDEGGLFQMGLPQGFKQRLQLREYGSCLRVYFVDRLDQIHFKLYAAVDRGGYHISDLEALQPTESELIQGARWAQTHDVSQAFTSLLKELLRGLGHEEAAESI